LLADGHPAFLFEGVLGVSQLEFVVLLSVAEQGLELFFEICEDVLDVWLEVDLFEEFLVQFLYLILFLFALEFLEHLLLEQVLLLLVFLLLPSVLFL
jgi:hypothetical protein